MPPALSYPGVYIQELSSGVHTITGVATSIGAFFGQASRGLLNVATECFSYSDYARNFGDPLPGTNLAQSVQQFFSNGGSDCFVTRLANGATASQVTLKSIGGSQVLVLSAVSPGLWGAGLSVKVDYQTSTPDSTFNLQVSYSVNNAVVQTESLGDLSMDPSSPRYAPTFITQSSRLLAAQPSLATASTLQGYSEGRLPKSGAKWSTQLLALWPAGDLAGFLISVDGSPSLPVNLSKQYLSAGGGISDAVLKAYIEAQVYAALGSNPAWKISVNLAGSSFVTVTSVGAAQASVQIQMAAPAVDLAQKMMLGAAQGGIEVTRFSDLRPAPNGIFFEGNGTTGETLPLLDPLAAAGTSTITTFGINPTPPVSLTFPGGPKFWNGLGGPGDFDGLRQNLQYLANTINTNFPGYLADVDGYRMTITNTNPSTPQALDALTFAATGAGKNFLNALISNVPSYILSSGTTGTYFLSGPPPSDGSPPAVSDYVGSELLRTGFYALDAVDLFNIMVLPGDGITSETQWGLVRAAAASYCQTRRAFLVLDAPLGWTINNLMMVAPIDVQKFRAPLGNQKENCAVYYPRVQFNDNGTLRYIGPSGMVAGMYAATDASRGVWKAPAGTQAALNGVQNLEVVLTDKQNGVLNPQAVNCLRSMPSGYVIWGARTVDGYTNSGDSDSMYVPVRRFTLFLEESLYRGTQWVVFEPNGDTLWAQIRMNIGAFMMSLYRQGAFKGTTPQDAYFVKCDSETTTQDDIDSGIVNIIVGFAPLKPAEFVIIKIQQIADMASTS